MSPSPARPPVARSLPTEHDEQVTLFAYAALHETRWPELAMLTAVPNGGHRHKAVAGKLKAEGVKPGYPDILLDVARGGYFGLRIELKRKKGGRVSAAQEGWNVMLTQQGYLVMLCYGWEEAWAMISDYLSAKPTQRVPVTLTPVEAEAA